MDKKQLEIVDQLYKSILKPDSWEDLIQRICEDLGVFGCNLVVIDKVFAEMQSSYVSKSLIEPFQRYVEDGFYDQEVAITETLENIAAGDSLVSLSNIVSEYNRLSSHPVDLTASSTWMKNNYNINQRYFYSLGNHKAQLDILSISLSDLNKSAEIVNRCNFYLPHLANLVNTSRPFMLLNARFKAVLDVLNRFNLAVFLLSSEGELIDQNEAAYQIVTAKDAILLNQKKRIQFTDNKETALFLKRLKLLSNYEGKANKSIFTLERASRNTPYLCELSAIMHNDIPLGALLIVADPEKKQLINTDNFDSLFGLTRSEKEVCQMLAQGQTNREISEQRNTNIETTRSQTKSVLNKTGTNRQVDLVRLAFSINLPVDAF